ncbi:hypothetical protein DWB61_15770 [Ancylomarina euxinus]|uniref:Bacterial surface antigen (D15) domain-containing protein n=1 Tax=Ancylomarina euxinus TaxID=2283627 RepID=A0A425XXG9_9BACT|nr:hypothetical protein [Ancylomarina euxinus]MCZ4696075.1 hypothetical protein [Ancylomarina euxinus]MUP16484.1 hypothetical protein [Ancylomarina euxinus]RRG19360.1 hypothetical protein DWB61_15770 [Ancylomarina euxinus]
MSEDSLLTKPLYTNLQDDTLKKGSDFYKKLKSKAYKNRITKELYGLFFVSPNKEDLIINKKREQSGQVFVPYEGKRINKLIIDVIQPFKPNFIDSLQKTRIWLEKTANKLHNTSSRNHIKKLLYLKEGDTLDAYNTAENERLIRNLPYVKDAQFIVIPVMGSSELVDLYLLVKDQFSWGFDIDIGSITSTSVELYNRNLYGRGHEIRSGFEYNSSKSQNWGYLASYKVQNVINSHISAGLTFSNNYKRSLIELALKRRFETYMTKYAGGLTVSRTMHSNKISSNDPILNKEPLDFNYASAWFGRSYKLLSENKLEKSQLFSTLGFSSLNFFKRPKVDSDLNKFFHNKRIYLASISLNQTQYFKSNLIYNFGRTEDIPYGYMMQLTGGFEDREFSYRKYLAFEYQRATHFYKTKAYFFTKFSLGGYFDKDHYEQGNLILQNKFISRLRKTGRYRFRNFVELNYNLGIRRFPEEFITLNSPTGIRGFSSLEAIGTQRLTMKLENITFTPYMAAGFRFAFFNFLDIGTIGSNQHHPFKNKAYYGIGLGLRLNNENLVFKTIELRFALYPKAPSDFSNTQYGLSGEDRPNFSNFNVGRPKVLDFE